MKNYKLIAFLGIGLIIIILSCFFIWNSYSKSIATNNLQNYCYYDAKKYEKGSSFRDRDNCNDCSCSDDLQVSCTTKYCESNFSSVTSLISSTSKETVQSSQNNYKCFNAVIEIEGAYKWKDSCAGIMCELASKTECSGDLVDLTSQEINDYLNWVDKGSLLQEQCGCYITN